MEPGERRLRNNWTRIRWRRGARRYFDSLDEISNGIVRAGVVRVGGRTRYRIFEAWVCAVERRAVPNVGRGTYCPQALQNPLLRLDYPHGGGLLHCSDANQNGSVFVALRHLGMWHQDKYYTLSLH